jgi:hypothetical protein
MFIPRTPPLCQQHADRGDVQNDREGHQVAGKRTIGHWVNTDVGGSVSTTARAWLARKAVPTAPIKSRRPSRPAMTLDIYADLFDDDLEAVAVALRRSAQKVWAECGHVGSKGWRADRAMAAALLSHRGPLGP